MFCKSEIACGMYIDTEYNDTNLKVIIINFIFMTRLHLQFGLTAWSSGNPIFSETAPFIPGI
jgi:hypothetical protein